MIIANSKPIKLTGLASHLNGFDELVKALALDKINFPCKSFDTGDVGESNKPIVFIPSLNGEYPLCYFETEE